MFVLILLTLFAPISSHPQNLIDSLRQETSPSSTSSLYRLTPLFNERGVHSSNALMKTQGIASKIEKADISSVLFKKTYLKKATRRTAAYNKRFEKANTKYLRQYIKADLKMQKKMCKTNPDMAEHLFSYSADPLLYHQKDISNPAWMKKRPPQTPPKEGNTALRGEGGLDTLKTAISFLKQQPEDSVSRKVVPKESGLTLNAKKETDTMTSAGLAPLRETKQAEFTKAEKETKQLEQNLNYSEKLQQYFKQRRMQFKDASIKNPDLQKDYIKMDKINYYYRQQVAEYKRLFTQAKSKAEKVAMNALNGNKTFRQFMQKSSQLKAVGSPQSAVGKSSSDKSKSEGDSKTGQSKGVMQTVKGVKEMMQRDIAALGPQAGKVLQEKMKPMADAMSKLQSGNYGNTTNAGDLPDFKPNALKTKRLIDRLQFGTDFKPIKNSRQSVVGSRQYGPTFDIPNGGSFGLTLGYQLTKKIVVRVGASHDLGVYATWKKIKFNSLGTGLRSFADWKAKKAIFIEGAFERNLMSILSTGSSTPAMITKETTTYQKWVSSALLGIKLKPGIVSSPTMTILYDFLHNHHTPATAALVYRFGWAFGKN